MNKNKIFYLLFALLLGIMGCEKDIPDPEIISKTPPELQFLVVKEVSNGSITYQELSGAQVTLYRTIADRDASVNAIGTKTTGTDGIAIFNKEELAEPGQFHYRVIYNAEEKIGSTKYLLLTDGQTLQRVVF